MKKITMGIRRVNLPQYNSHWTFLAYQELTCYSVAKSCPTLFDLMTAPCQASLSFTISQRLLKFMSIESVMLSNYLIFCHPLLLLPSIFPGIRVYCSESTLPIRWPKYWSFRFSISLFNEYSVLFSFRTDVTIKRVTDHLNRKLVRKRGCGKNTNNKLFYEAPYSPPPPLYVWSILTSFAAPSETQEEGRNMQPGES